MAAREASPPRGGPPRVLFVIGGLNMGGSERQLVELVLRTHPELLEATVVTYDPSHGSELRDRLAGAGVRHAVLGPVPVPPLVRPMVTVSRLHRLVRSVRPDVIYAWLEEASVISSAVARGHGIPLVIARRNVSGANIERSRSRALVIRRAERSGTLVTGNSNAVIEAARRRGIDPARLRLVRNGHPWAPPLLPPSTAPVTIGYVARFRPEKGHFRLLSALARLPRRLPWRVDLAGDGALVDQVMEMAGELGLGERVRSVGPVSDVRAFWASHSVAALLSDHEGLPNALIEAAFAGRPIIGTNVGGIPEVVAPAGGILVPPDHPELTADALRRLIEDPSLRQQLGKAAHEQAQERFAVEAFVDGHLEVIREALALVPRGQDTQTRLLTP